MGGMQQELEVVPTYQVGPDELDFPTTKERLDWIVYYYESSGWEGNGEAVAKLAGQDVLVSANLGHCSCYGPMDDWGDWTESDRFSVAAFLDSRDSVNGFITYSAVEDKVIELLEKSHGVRNSSA